MKTVNLAANLLSVAICLVPAKVQVPLDDSKKRGTLEVVVVDSFGNPVEGATLYMQRLGGREASPKIRLDQVPVAATEYGICKLMAEKSGFEPGSRVVSVHDLLSIVAIVLVPGEIEKDGSATVVRGQLNDLDLAPEATGSG